MNVDVAQEQIIMIKFLLITESIESAEIYHRLSAVFKSDNLLHSRMSEWCFHSGNKTRHFVKTLIMAELHRNYAGQHGLSTGHKDQEDDILKLI